MCGEGEGRGGVRERRRKKMETPPQAGARVLGIRCPLRSLFPQNCTHRVGLGLDLAQQLAQQGLLILLEVDVLADGGEVGETGGARGQERRSARRGATARVASAVCPLFFFSQGACARGPGCAHRPDRVHSLWQSHLLWGRGATDRAARKGGTLFFFRSIPTGSCLPPSSLPLLPRPPFRGGRRRCPSRPCGRRPWWWRRRPWCGRPAGRPGGWRGRAFFWGVEKGGEEEAKKRCAATHFFFFFRRGGRRNRRAPRNRLPPPHTHTPTHSRALGQTSGHAPGTRAAPQWRPS